MVKTTIENSKYAASLLLIEGNYEYFKILDNNLADVMNKNITAEEAAKRIEAELEQDHRTRSAATPDPDLAQGRRERHLPRQVLSACSVPKWGRCLSAARQGPGAWRRDPRSSRREPAKWSRHQACDDSERWPRLHQRRDAPPQRPAAELRRRFARWLASERVFRLIPFVLVEGAVRPHHPGPLRPDDLDQPAQMARQPSVRDGALLRP